MIEINILYKTIKTMDDKEFDRFDTMLEYLESKEWVVLETWKNYKDKSATAVLEKKIYMYQMESLGENPLWRKEVGK